MGNWPSISLVLRRTAPAWKTAWLGSRLTLTSSTPLGGDDPAELAQRAGRDVRLELAADPALELGPLDREPVGVGRDHRHLLAAGADQDPGQNRAHVVARGGAGDQLDGLGQRLGRDRQRLAVGARGASGSPRRGGCGGGSASRRSGSRRRARPPAARSRPCRRRAIGPGRRGAGPAGARCPRPRRTRRDRSAARSPRRSRAASTALSAAATRIPEAPGSRRGSRRLGRRLRALRSALLVASSASRTVFLSSWFRACGNRAEEIHSPLRCGFQAVDVIVGKHGFLQWRRPSAGGVRGTVDRRAEAVDARQERLVLVDCRRGPPQ